MLEVHFVQDDKHEFTGQERASITAEADAAYDLAHNHLPLLDRVQLLVRASTAVLDATGDNACTIRPDLIRWSVDPSRGVIDVCRARLIKSFLHEAYHAARFRELASEAEATTWLDIAIGEGLATAFARDAGDAHEPWANYDPSTIASWAQELFSASVDAPGLAKWKFQHPDGREWIAFRVGTWLVDQICELRSATPAELVWVPVDELVESLPIDLRGQF